MNITDLQAEYQVTAARHGPRSIKAGRVLRRLKREVNKQLAKARRVRVKAVCERRV